MSLSNRFPLYIVINEYNKRMDDELDMKPGDKIQVITDDQEYNDGWYYGKNLRSGFEGLYPKCFTQEISMASSGQSLVRTKSTRRLVSPAFSGSTASLDSDYPYSSSNSNNNHNHIQGMQPASSPHAFFQRNFSGTSYNSQHSGNSNSNNINSNNINSNSNSNNNTGSSMGLMNGASRRFSRLLSNNSNNSSPVDSAPVTTPQFTSSNPNSNARNMMINNTLSDIDQALAELQYSSLMDSPTIVSNMEDKSLKTTTNGEIPKNLKPEECGSWTPEEVATYLLTNTEIEKDVCSKFIQHKINGKVLLDLEMIHLKQELDIVSFGTRYELFKEIEILKQAWDASHGNNNNTNSNTNNSNNNINNSTPHTSIDSKTALPTRRSFLMPAPSFDNHSSSQQEFKTPIDRTSMNRPLSLALPIDAFASPTLKTDFVSPRKAPQPPSYPSPVQPPQSPERTFTKKSPNSLSFKKDLSAPQSSNNNNISNNNNNNNMIHPYKLKMYENNNNTLQSPLVQGRKPSNTGEPSSISPLSNGSIGGGNFGPSHINNGIKTRRSSSTMSSNSYTNSHRRSVSGGSFIDLFNRLDVANPHLAQGDKNDRPTSSIYEHSRTNSVAHSRKSSFTHSRNTSFSRPATASTINEHVSLAPGTAGSAASNPKTITSTIEESRRNSMFSSFKNLNDIPVSTKRGDSITSTPTLGNKRSNSIESKDSDTPDSRNSDFFDAYNDENESIDHRDSIKKLKHQSDMTTTGSINTGTPMSNGTHLSTIISGKSRLGRVSTTGDALVTEKRDTKPVSSSTRTSKTGSKLLSTPSSAKQSAANMSAPELQHAFSQSNVKTTKTKMKKKNTSAFQEGIKTITVQDSMKDATCFGWMSKKGSGTVGVWKSRFFILHGTRLSYFQNTTASKERGLIDITAHKVLPTRDDDRLVSLYAASTGKGRYCFKVVPPAPGSKKGLTFTQQRVHYFAVETKEEMRQWMSALIKATIDIDTSVPIISSCATPTVSLSEAQEMLDEARRETQLREQERKLHELNHGNGGDDWETQQRYVTPEVENIAETGSGTPSSAGFQSPYLLASGTFKKNSIHSPIIAHSPFKSNNTSSMRGNDTFNFSNGSSAADDATRSTNQTSDIFYSTRLDPKYGNKL